MEQTVDTQHMAALKALSDLNLKVSEARNMLVKLQETETEYLVSREKKAVERIQVALDASHALVEETNKNYDLISDLTRSVAESCSFLDLAHESFTGLTAAFSKKQERWENDLKNTEETIGNIQKSLKIERNQLEGDKKTLEMTKKSLQQAQVKLDDERAMIDRQIKRLKEGRI